MKKFLLLCSAVVFTLSSVLAQERTVSGKVTSTEDGSVLPGVNVLLKGTTSGTVTDSDGNFKLSIPSSGGALVFSFIGLQTTEVEIGDRSVVDVSLSLDVTQLSEIVVTAQGVARDKKALGYAVSSVGQDQIAARPVNDISRVLTGKIPGVVIAPTGGSAGAGSSINIRGFSSLTGSTQPLWVVDGVPFNTSTNNNSDFTTGGTAGTSSRFLDIDPNTIESINVLKGLAATVLYGDQGRNGVILVTTKAGSAKKKQAELSVQQSLSISEIASLPKFQNSYGNGFQQLYGQFFSNWGPKFSELDSVGSPYQFLGDASLRDAYPEFWFKREPYEAAPNIGGFFRKGVVSNTAVNLSGGTDKLGFNASTAYTKEQGYAPGNDLTRLNAAVGFNTAVTDKLTIRSSIAYTRTEVESPPLNGATGGGASFGGVPSIYGQFLYTPRNIDVLNLPYETPLEHKSIYYRGGNDIPNPRWVAANVKELEKTDRFFFTNTIAYDFTENLSLSYRVGYDYYTTRSERQFNKGVGPTYATIDRGVYSTSTLTNTIWNHDLILSFNKELSTDINMSATVGLNARNDYRVRDGLYSEGQSVFGLFRHSNFTTFSSRDVAFAGLAYQSTTEQQRYGTYANFTFDYKNYLFLNVAGRNDWTSTLEKGNNSLFYPSASVSFDATEAISAIKSDKINFIKFRVGYGTSAGFANPYSTRNIITQNLRSYLAAGATAPIGSHSISNQLGNPNLKAELQKELEIGFETKFLNNRLGIDFTVYDRSTKNLITNAPIDPATGFTNIFTNVGKLQNRGIEIALNGTPLKMANGLQWDVTLNYTAVRPEVVELGAGVDEVVLAGFTTRGNFAIPGMPTNIMKGSVSAKSPSGERIVGTDGLYTLNPTLGVLGNPNPDWQATLINSFSFKGVSFSFQWDYRQGGDMYAGTASSVIGRGVSTDIDAYDHDLVLILPGVRQSGFESDGVTPKYVPNDIQITASDYGFNTQFFSDDVAMFDATTIRLREVALGYNFPKSLFSKTPIKNMSLQLTANNMFFKAVNVPKGVNFDPEVSSQGVGNGAGFDYLTGPSSRRYGAVLRITF